MKIFIRSLIIFVAGTIFLYAENRETQPLPLLKVSKSGRYLIKENGEPFFWLGDTAWNLFIRLNREEAQRYLKDRKDKKFTIIQAHLLGWNLNDINAYGALAFKDNNFNSPNETYWKHVDYIIKTASKMGLYLALLPAWASSYTEPRRTKSADTVNLPLRADTATAYHYARFLGTRYKNYKNIIWILGGDVWGTKDGIYDNIAMGLTETFADGDPSSIIMSFHPQGGTNRPPATSSSEFYQGKSWLDFNMIQSGHRVGNKNYERIKKDYDTLPVKPTMESEPSYEQHPVQHLFKNGVFKAIDLRQRAYWSLFAGGFGFTYGANGIWQMDKADKIEQATHHNFFWYEALDFEGAKQMAFVRSLMESRPFIHPERVPDQAMVLSENSNAEGHIQCTRADDYSYAMVYSTNGSAFQVDLSGFKDHEVNAWWYNPRDGETYNGNNKHTRKPFKIIQKNGSHTFDPPGAEGVDNDWILVIDDGAKMYGVPGERAG